MKAVVTETLLALHILEVPSRRLERELHPGHTGDFPGPGDRALTGGLG